MRMWNVGEETSKERKKGRKKERKKERKREREREREREDTLTNKAKPQPKYPEPGSVVAKPCDRSASRLGTAAPAEPPPTSWAPQNLRLYLCLAGSRTVLARAGPPEGHKGKGGGGGKKGEGSLRGEEGERGREKKKRRKEETKERNERKKGKRR